MQSRRTNIILCGDWNVNFLQCSSKLSELQNLLQMYNLINTVKSPTRITHNSITLIDVMVIDLNWENQTIVYDLGYSDHLAQIAYIKVDKPVLEPQAIKKRQFTDKAIEGFIYLLQKESWNQVMLLEDVNESFNAFMLTFMCHFNALFPVKTVYLNNKNKIKWITKGIMVSRNRLIDCRVIFKEFSELKKKDLCY